MVSIWLLSYPICEHLQNPISSKYFHDLTILFTSSITIQLQATITSYLDNFSSIFVLCHPSGFSQHSMYSTPWQWKSNCSTILFIALHWLPNLRSPTRCYMSTSPLSISLLWLHLLSLFLIFHMYQSPHFLLNIPSMFPLLCFDDSSSDVCVSHPVLSFRSLQSCLLLEKPSLFTLR